MIKYYGPVFVSIMILSQRSFKYKVQIYISDNYYGIVTPQVIISLKPKFKEE